jgi:hypothetical protein
VNVSGKQFKLLFQIYTTAFPFSFMGGFIKGYGGCFSGPLKVYRR